MHAIKYRKRDSHEAFFRPGVSHHHSKTKKLKKVKLRSSRTTNEMPQLVRVHHGPNGSDVWVTPAQIPESLPSCRKTQHSSIHLRPINTTDGWTAPSLIPEDSPASLTIPHTSSVDTIALDPLILSSPDIHGHHNQHDINGRHYPFPHR